MTSKEKAKYRTTSEWKNWAKYLVGKCNNKCEICNIEKKSYLNPHHHDEANYMDLKEDKFSILCRADHVLVERLLRRKEFNIDSFCEALKRIYLDSKKYERTNNP